MAEANHDSQTGITLLKQTFQEFSDDNATSMAAALAYYTIFSLPPLLVLLITLAGLFLSPEQVEGWLTSQFGSLVGSDAAAQVQTMVENASQRVSGGFSVGLILSIVGLLFGATGAFAQLQQALNTAWEVEPDPEQAGVMSFVTKRVLSLGMILVIAFLLLVALVLSSVISALSGQMGQLLSQIGIGGVSTALVWAVNIGISLLIITLLFAAIFKVLPDAKVAWRDVWVGAFATALLFVIGKFLIGLYIGQSSPGEAFGAAAALAVLLVWVYYSAIIVFLGAEFTQVWARTKGQGIAPDDGAVRVVTEKRHVRPNGEAVGQDNRSGTARTR